MILQVVFFALSISCIFYGAAVMCIGSGSLFYLAWYLLAAAFLGMAALSRFHLWHRITRPAWMAALVLLAAGAVLFVYLLGRVLSGFHETGREDAAYLIVLGAQVFEGGPSVSLQYRLDAAAAYLKDNPETICIVSGGQGSNEPFPEAVGMQRYLTENGVDPSRILPEDKSENTVMNIRCSKALISDPACSVGIVTNDFHMYRALMLARREGLQNAFGIAARSNPVFLPNNTLREVFGLAKDLLLK